jgi:AcrR family transcriptional regulator
VSAQALSTRAALLAAARAELAENGEGALSLRAVARRAGLSHATPGHFFGDRRGLLTALAAEGFDLLADRLADTAPGLSPLGRAYVDFAVEHPGLVDLMFRRSELRVGDPELQRAQAAAIGRLAGAVQSARGGDPTAWTLVSWAFVHGLVVLGREGVLAPLAGGDSDLDAARGLIELYAREVEGSAPSDWPVADR